jgi:glycosyltransferase involved in cell wall biosynthesis
VQGGGVTVITLTRSRTALLARAIASVERQEPFGGPLEHLVLVDDCEETRRSLAASDLPPSLRWRFFRRENLPESLVPRLARLRNLGVRLARTRWIAFLDDDNEFEPGHLATLVACARATGSPAVHSWGRIFHRDGSPYLEPRIPWAFDPVEAERQHAELCAAGVWENGSNLLRDRADPRDHPNPVRSVDTGMWLFERSLLLRFPFPERYSAEDWATMTTEDDKLMELLIDHDVPVACTRLATFRYYVGGYSTPTVR